jgi:uncharacterized membrane protein
MIRLVLLFIALSLPLQAQEFPAFHSVTGVAANDVLNIRSRPDAGAPIIGMLAPTATGVEVVATVGNWAVVNSGEGAGYASMTYLSRAAGPDWNALQTPLSCLGTEPFWSLEIDPAAGETRFSTPEDPSPDPDPITALWPAEPWAQAAGVGLTDGLAVLTGAECSDGMSDRRYGIAVDILRNGPTGETRATGCCRLTPP